MERALSFHSAFSAGCQLWVVSDPEHSVWGVRVDWHLHFQLHTLRHQKLDNLEDTVRRRIKHPLLHPIEWGSWKPLPLLVESSAFLPNRWVLEVSYHTRWLTDVYQIWSALNQPTIRVFVPGVLTKKQWIAGWTKLAGRSLLPHYVMDEEGGKNL